MLELQKEQTIIADATRRLQIKQLLHNDPRLFFNYKPEVFFTAMAAYASSQQYGPRIQNYLAEQLGGLVRSTKDEGGDYRVVGSSCIVEFKATYNNSGQGYNMVQIRPYEAVDLYFVCAIEPDDGFNPVYFLLTHDQMLKEVLLMGGLAHMTQETSQHNKNKEYRISLPCFGSEWARWMNSYSVGSLDCVRLRFENFVK